MAISLAPVSGIDLFTDAARLDPHALWRELRDTGPVVYLSANDVYAISRHATAVEVLDDWQRYSSAQGVFMNAPLNEQLGGRITLCLDPPEHTGVRELLSRPLKADAMRELRPSIVDTAEAIVDRLVGQGTFDAATELAEALPMTVVADLIGLGEHGRDNMLRWAAATWEAQGPLNDRTAAGGPVVAEFIEFAMTEAVPGKLVAGSWADQLYAAADRGEIPREQCPFLMLDYVTPSLDTTIYAISNAVRLFAEHPDQWDRLRGDIGLISSAINETLRLESPVPHFTRVVTEDHELSGVQLRAGDRVMVLFGSANRDERAFVDPDRFDVGRRGTDHLAFGRGEHGCIGMQLARLEMDSLLRALARRVQRFEILESEQLLSNSLHGMKTLRVAVH
jgi:cytochrome P450